MRNKKGISLITLVLIIVAILVISTIVLVVLINNNKKQQTNNQSDTKLSELSAEEKENYSSEIQLILDYANQSQYVDINEESAQQLVAFSHKNGIGAITDIDCFGTVEYNENGKTIYAWTIILYGEQDSFRADVSENDGVIYSITYNDKVYYKKDIENIDVKNETSTEKENNDAENQDATIKGNFWVDNYKSWKTQKEECQLVLFDGKCTTPIDLKTLDSFVKRYDYNVQWDGVNVIDTKRNTKTINDIINSEEMIGSATTIWMYYGNLNEFTNYGYKDSLKVDINNYNFNYSEIDGYISLKDAINKNWWCIQNSTSDPANSLGIDIEDNSYDKATNAIPLLNKVIEILGGPKHIYIFDKTSQDNYKEVRYWLSYEYDEFVLTIEVDEGRVGDYYQCGIKSVNYFTKETFEKEIDKKSKKDGFEIMK